MAVAVYGSDPILGEDSTTASVVAILVFALNLSVLPFAYRRVADGGGRVKQCVGYRSVARRLRRRRARRHRRGRWRGAARRRAQAGHRRGRARQDEVEALLGGADIAEVVRKCGRHALRQAFDGHLDDKDWDYFTHTLLKLEGVWTEDVAAADVLQWHVKAILYQRRPTSAATST